MRRYLIFILLFVMAGSMANGQIMPAKDSDRVQYWSDKEGMIIQQDNISLGFVTEMLEKYPPAPLPSPTGSISPERNLALSMIDQILHQEKASTYPPVQRFFHLRIEKVVRELKATKVTDGAMIWKLYNHGFIVRTATVTIGFDLIRGHSADTSHFAIPERLAGRIVDACDILFISHRHPDHADKWVVQRFIDQGKPVIAPPDLWTDDALYEQLSHLPRKIDSLQWVPIQGGKEKLGVVNYPGHQGPGETDPKNAVVVVVTPEQITIAHTGDQNRHPSDLQWIDKIKDHYKVDFLMVNSWATHVKRVVRGINPKVLFTGHENELLWHSIDHREPYWLNHTRLEGLSIPYLVLTWGEDYHYYPRNFK